MYELWQYIRRKLDLLLKSLLSILFSKLPAAPEVQVEDVRCNRVKIKIIPQLSSRFNVESYEAQYAPEDTDDWTSMGALEHVYRTLAPLKPDSWYQFRVRASNRRGVSRFSKLIKEQTKLYPVNAGAVFQKYTWTQNELEVIVSVKVFLGTKSSDVSVRLTKQSTVLSVVQKMNGKENQILFGCLCAPIRSFSDGSVWELVTENDNQRWLLLTLEKEEKAASVKFDYWQHVFVDDPKIDTHAIENNNQQYKISKQEPSLGDWMQVNKEE
eukprot:TRINITY_DN95572_c0_g1_i1.p1 TRINITY_DN95572_c0_g1~~TRINITY_DN95572_c0_g1_i1.p1  ORF type:complete len:269 (-),score=22.28 TRINITY_DN95572_c0_g1_i1:96-902(-)